MSSVTTWGVGKAQTQIFRRGGETAAHIARDYKLRNVSVGNAGFDSRLSAKGLRSHAVPYYLCDEEVLVSAESGSREIV